MSIGKIPGIKSFHRGDTRKYKVTMTDKSTGQPVSVDGGVLTITFKKEKETLDADAELQVVTPGVEADVQNPTGEILATLPAAATAVLEPEHHYYDFQFVSSTGEVTTILPQENQVDKVKILEDITRSS